MSRLLLVRHGNTRLDNASRFWGKTEVALNDDGTRQAEKLRDRLAAQKLNAVYASNLSRARVTAEIIASRHHLEVITLAELDELNFGLAEGLTFDEIKRLHPELAEVLNSRKIRPKFPGGESLDELNGRVGIFLKRLEKHKPNETILIAAHAGTLRLIICNLMEISIEHWWQLQLDFASLSIVETYPQGAILSLLNDTSHLKTPETFNLPKIIFHQEGA